MAKIKILKKVEPKIVEKKVAPAPVKPVAPQFDPSIPENKQRHLR